ncbi:MAG: hypothetical protein QOJ48_704, partial [Frankiales bacterium]|nr:hypothetical protein [Frankiales bacterium]
DTLEHTKKMRFGMLSPADDSPVELAERPTVRTRRKAS